MSRRIAHIRVGMDVAYTRASNETDEEAIVHAFDTSTLEILAIDIHHADIDTNLTITAVGDSPVQDACA